MYPISFWGRKKQTVVGVTIARTVRIQPIYQKIIAKMRILKWSSKRLVRAEARLFAVIKLRY